MRKCILIVLILVFTSMLSSCSDNREIDSIATVMAIGVDKGTGKRNYTFAIADTGSVSGETRGDETSLLCFSAEGNDIEEAINVVDSRTSKKLSFSHLSVVMFSKEVAFEGVYEEIEYLNKKMAVRPQTILSSVNISAQEFLKGLDPYLEVNSEKYFENVFTDGKNYVPTVRLSDFYNACHTKTLVFMPLISADGGKINEDNTYVSESLVIENGRAQKTFEAPWLLGLIESGREVYFGDLDIKRCKKPDIEVDMGDGNLDVYVHFTLCLDENIDLEEFCISAEDVLEENAKAGYDIIDVRKHIKKKFYLQKSYEEFDFYKALISSRFHVSAERVWEKEI